MVSPGVGFFAVASPMFPDGFGVLPALQLPTVPMELPA
jgi:hypothetical protein